MKILIVDDKEDVRMILKMTIQSIEGIELKFEEAKNGEEAVEKFESFNPDIIFMDMKMPKVSGSEAIIEINKLDENARNKIVILSAYSDNNETEKIVKEGLVKDVIEKPPGKNEITNVIENFNLVK